MKQILATGGATVSLNHHMLNGHAACRAARARNLPAKRFRALGPDEDDDGDVSNDENDPRVGNAAARRMPAGASPQEY